MKLMINIDDDQELKYAMKDYLHQNLKTLINEEFTDLANQHLERKMQAFMNSMDEQKLQKMVKDSISERTFYHNNFFQNVLNEVVQDRMEDLIESKLKKMFGNIIKRTTK